MAFRYKVVPFVGRMKAGGNAGEVASQLEAAINQHAAEGWEFYTLNDVSIEVSPGCLGGLFGAKTGYIQFDQLIFRRAA